MKLATSIRLSAEAERIRDDLKNRLGITKAAVIEMAIRELARKYELKQQQVR